MQKKVIVLAIAAALSAPAVALAGDTSFYGQLNMSVDMVKDGAAAPASSKSYNQLNSNQSRLGLKNTEDLGGGMSVVVQLEGTILGDVGSSTLFDRNSYLGLNSSYGLVFVGRHDTPYKIATRRLDLFADGIADNRGSQADAFNNPLASSATAPRMGGGHDARLSNVLAYVSPAFSGVTVAAATVFGAENQATVATADKKGSAYSLAAMYDQGPIYGTFAYQTVTVGDAGTGDLGSGFLGLAVDDKATAMKLGGSYTVDKFGVNLVLEKLKTTFNATSTDESRTNIYLAGKFNVTASDAVKLAYTKIGDSSGTAVAPGAKDGNKQTTLGYDHAMSKQTTVYALYTKLSENATNSAAPSALSVGMRHAF